VNGQAEQLAPQDIFDSGPLEDEEIGASGRELFAFVDQEENIAP
jgi:hypothetical protein